MSESIQNDTISETVREFVQYYENEIGKNVNHIYELIEQLKTDSTNYPLLAEIESSAQAISDLAMVYGFEGVEVIALSDVNEIKLKEVAKKFSISKTFTDYKELLKLKEIEARINDLKIIVEDLIIPASTPNTLNVSNTLSPYNSTFGTGY